MAMSGLDVDWVAGLDLLSFDSLVGSVSRELARGQHQSVIDQRVAANAEVKTFKNYIKSIEDRAQISPPQEGADSFLKKHNKGI